MKIIQLSPRGGGRSIFENGINFLIRNVGLKNKVDFGLPGKSQAGDTAVRQSLRWLLQKEFRCSHVLSMESRKIFDHGDVEKINQADLLVVGGGGLLLSDTFRNTVSDWQWGISAELINRIKIPIVVYSIGYNRFRGQRDFNPIFNKTLAKLVDKSIFFSLRNTGSCESIKKYLPQKLHHKIKLNYCSTLLFNEKFKLKRNEDSRKTVGFVFAGDRLQNRHKAIQTYISHIKKFVNYLKAQDISTILINHSNDTWMKEHVEFDHYINLFGKDSKYIYHTYCNIDTVVGDRGHGQMIPFACGCKLLTPISHDKLFWFLQDVNLEQFGIEEADENLSEKLAEKYEELCSVDWENMWTIRMNRIKETNSQNMKFIQEQLQSRNMEK